MALFTQVYILAVTPLPFIKFWREVLLFSNSQTDAEHGGRPAREGLRRPQRGVLGLGRGPPWPRLALAGQAAGSSGAATEHRQASVAGSGSFVDGEHTVVTARPRAWGVGRGAVGIHGGDAGGLQEKEQRRKGARPRRPWRPRSGTRAGAWAEREGDGRARE